MKKTLLILLILPFISLAQCPTNITLTSQSDIDSFSTTYPNCTEIPGRLNIFGTSINDLTPLGIIVSVGSLEIFDTQLTTLNGLENLSFIEFQPNDQTSLILFANFELIDLSGLSNITANVPISIEIYECSSLVNLNGLASISQLESLIISDSNSLVSLEGLSQNLGFYPNTSGSSALFILANENLQNLDAFDSTINFGSDITLEISDNPSLNVCENVFICSLLDSSSSTLVVNNATGCNSSAELEIACDNLSIDDNKFTQVELYPNPVVNTLFIRGIIASQMDLFSLDGKHVLEEQDSDVLDMAFLKSGVYFLKITSGKGSITKRIIKE